MQTKSGHFKEVCSECSEVQAQCRCPGPKETRYVICAKCQNKKK